MDHIEVGNRSHNEVLCVVCVHFMPIPAFIHHWYAFHPPITEIDVGRIVFFTLFMLCPKSGKRNGEILLAEVFVNLF